MFTKRQESLHCEIFTAKEIRRSEGDLERSREVGTGRKTGGHNLGGKKTGSKMTLTQNEDAGAGRSTNCLLTAVLGIAADFSMATIFQISEVCSQE